MQSSLLERGVGVCCLVRRGDFAEKGKRSKCNSPDATETRTAAPVTGNEPAAASTTGIPMTEAP